MTRAPTVPLHRLRHILRRAPAALRRRREQGPLRGYVDGLNSDGIISGWVVERESGRGLVSVGLYDGDRLLEAGSANILREDVRVATGGEVQCGFQFVLSDMLMARISGGGHLTVRPVGREQYIIGHVRVAVDRDDEVPGESVMSACARVLRKDIEALLALLADVPETLETTPPFVAPPLALHDRLFTTEQVIPDIPQSSHPAYLDYVRYRYRMDEPYPLEEGLELEEHYLYWYLTAYRAQEARRVPLSRTLIDHLNERLVMAGQSHSLSRIMWWRLAARRDMLARHDLNKRDDYLDLLFWWANNDAPHLHFEDCLVPDRMADTLRGVHPSRRLDAWPLSYFTERYVKDVPQLRFLRPGEAEGRKMLALVILVRAAKRPDLLRFIPRRIIDALLTTDIETGTNPLEDFLNDMLAAKHREAATDASDTAQDPLPRLVALSRARYATALRARQFDLDSYAFLTRTPEGHRLEAATLPAPDPDREEVDVQLIGPLAKASGLGQATRLSADILRTTGLKVRGVDFDLDNPAPEGFSSDTLIEDYGPAKINIIHLNAESTPLAFAYQPDAFSDTYNIGYFFWELDKPAYCHYLGMEMLDEIWVSTEYGIEIYTPDAKGKPVVNVGMCYEDNADITRDDSRAFVNRRFQLDDSHHVCLVAFDSFSFVQRKNPVGVLQAFQKAFEGVPEARLIVKTQNRDSVFDPVQVQLWDRVDSIMSADPRIMIMNETLSYRDLLRLKCGSDCYVSLHKSEGWGFGMIEAMNLRVPVVCTAYSGNMDFCSDDTAWLVDYEIRKLRQGDYIFVRPDAEWAEPSVEHAAQQLRAAYDDPAARQLKADAAYAFIRDNFSAKAIGKRYGDRLREILADRSNSAPQD